METYWTNDRTVACATAYQRFFSNHWFREPCSASIWSIPDVNVCWTSVVHSWWTLKLYTNLFYVNVSGFSCIPVASISVISVLLSILATDASRCSYTVDYSFKSKSDYHPVAIWWAAVSLPWLWKLKMKIMTSYLVDGEIVSARKIKCNSFRTLLSCIHIVQSGGQCHLNHLTILRRFSWPSLAYMCTKVA